VTREAGEEIGSKHRRDRRALAAARLAGEAADPIRVVLRVHERDDLVADVGVVAAGAVRVDVLRAADRGERVDQDHPRVDLLAVEQLEKRRPERDAVPPHLDLSGEALQHVDDRTAGIARRRVDPERALVRVAERVSTQCVTDEHVLVEPTAQRLR
jgi:hypothetical protein